MHPDSGSALPARGLLWWYKGWRSKARLQLTLQDDEIQSSSFGLNPSTSLSSGVLFANTFVDGMDLKAKAIVCHDTLQDGGWKMEDVLVRPPGEGELLIEMLATGICHSDILVGSMSKDTVPAYGVYPRVLGHEGMLSVLRLYLPDRC